MIQSAVAPVPEFVRLVAGVTTLLSGIVVIV